MWGARPQPEGPYTPDIENEPDAGVFNLSADRIPRLDRTWSADELDGSCSGVGAFVRLVCRNCGGQAFEVLVTDDYETSTRCCKCGMYYIVQSG